MNIYKEERQDQPRPVVEKEGLLSFYTWIHSTQERSLKAATL